MMANKVEHGIPGVVYWSCESLGIAEGMYPTNYRFYPEDKFELVRENFPDRWAQYNKDGWLVGVAEPFNPKSELRYLLVLDGSAAVTSLHPQFIYFYDRKHKTIGQKR